MRYSKEHKAQSRARILESARRQFRRNGFEGASIDEVMAGAELTRGAFYAHFPSKQSLEAAVLSIQSGLEAELTEAARTGDPAGAAAKTLERYLQPANRQDVTEGCPLVTHPVDAVRGDPARRRRYRKHLDGVLTQLDEALGTLSEAPSDAAIRIAVLAIGGALLSGACGDSKLGDRIANACNDEIGRELTGT